MTRNTSAIGQSVPSSEARGPSGGLSPHKGGFVKSFLLELAYKPGIEKIIGLGLFGLWLARHQFADDSLQTLSRCVWNRLNITARLSISRFENLRIFDARVFLNRPDAGCFIRLEKLYALAVATDNSARGLFICPH